MLDQICDHLNPDGYLVIAVPNFDSIQRRLFSRYWFHLDLPRHLVHIESGWLVEKLRKRGYSIEQESYFDPIQGGYGFIQSAMNALFPSRHNQFYRLIKHGQGRSGKDLLLLWLWSLLSILLLPLALVESLISLLADRGATLQIRCRWNGDQLDQ
jgi:hypothetical protein